MEGKTIGEIAKALVVSNKTVYLHRVNTRKKLDLQIETGENKLEDDLQYCPDNDYCFVSISKTKTLAHFFAFLSRNTWWMGSA